MAVRTRLGTGFVLLLATLALAIPSQEAFGLIMGGEGNKALRDPGWPKGAAVIFNRVSRIAYWEGPPFGGGQWHAECRGDATALNGVLADFAELDVKSKRIVVHDGIGQSFWLNMNNEAGKREAAKMDWRFMVWVPANWQHLRKLPAEFNPTNLEDSKDGPPAQLDIYTGGNIKWADVKVPKGLTVVDMRLEAHGFTIADGVVLEGKVTDAATRKPIAARVWLERTSPRSLLTDTVADAQGHWVIKKAPAGGCRIVVQADGYVPRVVGYAAFDEHPKWHSYDTTLSRPGPVAGRVTDDAGKPLADVDVRVDSVVTEAGQRYEAPDGYRVKTDKDGRFRVDQIPIGKAMVWIHRSGYVRPGLGPHIKMPDSAVELKMTRSARAIVTVDFGENERPKGYIIQMAPEGGEKVGSYGGSGNINAKNEMTFDNVPPGRYVFRGRPNPGSEAQETEPVTVELKGGASTNVTLRAR
jgi:hypothetical protein